jgi:hypothetical protein
MKLKMFLSRMLYRVILFIFPDMFEGYSSQELNDTYAWHIGRIR